MSNVVAPMARKGSSTSRVLEQEFQRLFGDDSSEPFHVCDRLSRVAKDTQACVMAEVSRHLRMGCPDREAIEAAGCRLGPHDREEEHRHSCGFPGGTLHSPAWEELTVKRNCSSIGRAEEKAWKFIGLSPECEYCNCEHCRRHTRSDNCVSGFQGGLRVDFDGDIRSCRRNGQDQITIPGFQKVYPV
ncbi:unnamed protein product [Heligmosomoides polygyrus]|uniref:Uncharacterized protein n=1 Tax=Heligmosomoides polygyrus TaxID=6339 RepID=A0A183GJW4_HELPZ|nr:unnamed protein product [Heligmosomoides polygyrus]